MQYLKADVEHVQGMDKDYPVNSLHVPSVKNSSACTVRTAILSQCTAQKNHSKVAKSKTVSSASIRVFISRLSRCQLAVVHRSMMQLPASASSSSSAAATAAEPSATTAAIQPKPSHATEEHCAQSIDPIAR